MTVTTPYVQTRYAVSARNNPLTVQVTDTEPGDRVVFMAAVSASAAEIQVTGADEFRQVLYYGLQWVYGTAPYDATIQVSSATDARMRLTVVALRGMRREVRFCLAPHALCDGDCLLLVGANNAASFAEWDITSSAGPVTPVLSNREQVVGTTGQTTIGVYRGPGSATLVPSTSSLQMPVVIPLEPAAYAEEAEGHRLIARRDRLVLPATANNTWLQALALVPVGIVPTTTATNGAFSQYGITRPTAVPGYQAYLLHLSGTDEVTIEVPGGAVVAEQMPIGNGLENAAAWNIFATGRRMGLIGGKSLAYEIEALDGITWMLSNTKSAPRVPGASSVSVVMFGVDTDRLRTPFEGYGRIGILD